MLRKWILITIGLIGSLIALAQDNENIFPADTVKPEHKYLPEVTVVGRQSKSDYHQMPEVVGTSIYAGKKNA